MAERSGDKMLLTSPPFASQPRRLLPTDRKPERFKRGEGRREDKSSSALMKTPGDELLAKEEHFKLLNAQLDAKTADLVRQTEQIMRDQIDVLTKPFSTLVLTDIQDGEESWMMKSHQDRSVKVSARKKITSQNMGPRKQAKESQPKVSRVEDYSAVEYAAESFLANAIRNMEEKMSGAATDEENDADDLFNVGGNVVSDAQIRVLKAKLRIMQEELDQLSDEYYKKDDENAKLSTKMKELEEDRVRLQKTITLQQTQTEKQRVLAEESGKRSDDLQLQVSALHKEIQNLTRSHKQAAGVHSSTEVRLNRALEEVEKLKCQLSKMKQMNKDKISEEHESKESLLAENRMLKKQKSELVVGFKKQLKLIDVLKRQKMHFEAAKLLSFSEEEFMKALDWGKS